MTGLNRAVSGLQTPPPAELSSFAAVSFTSSCFCRCVDSEAPTHPVTIYDSNGVTTGREGNNDPSAAGRPKVGWGVDRHAASPAHQISNPLGETLVVPE